MAWSRFSCFQFLGQDKKSKGRAEVDSAFCIWLVLSVQTVTSITQPGGLKERQPGLPPSLTAYWLQHHIMHLNDSLRKESPSSQPNPAASMGQSRAHMTKFSLKLDSHMSSHPEPPLLGTLDAGCWLHCSLRPHLFEMGYGSRQMGMAPHLSICHIEICIKRKAFTPICKYLHDQAIRFQLLYPAKLRVQSDGRQLLFDDPVLARRHFNIQDEGPPG